LVGVAAVAQDDGSCVVEIDANESAKVAEGQCRTSQASFWLEQSVDGFTIEQGAEVEVCTYAGVVDDSITDLTSWCSGGKRPSSRSNETYEESDPPRIRVPMPAFVDGNDFR
jgi:hypothetical protein